ncbi:MAG TPA: DNA-binding protein [Candidatus Lokiarchaeia archaeon]|nr:DNA-binding protein [Candidatus Lokiarchaeia archaeon]
MSDDDEIAEIRRRKMEEMQKQAVNQQREKEAQDKYQEQKDLIMRKILSSEARQRLANLKMVRPELVDTIESQLIQLVQSGQVSRLGVKLPMSDENFKKLLTNLMDKQKKDFKIKKI